jgi:hypothetical protein
MTHSEFILRPEYATAKFFEVFAFVVHFQARHLQNEIETIISDDSLIELLAIEKSIKELAEKARQRILEEDIDPEFVFECPNCENDTFVIQDDINVNGKVKVYQLWENKSIPPRGKNLVPMRGELSYHHLPVDQNV